MTRTPDPKPKARKTQEKKTTTRRKPASSSIDSGDISPDLSQSGIQQFEAHELLVLAWLALLPLSMAATRSLKRLTLASTTRPTPQAMLAEQSRSGQR